MSTLESSKLSIMKKTYVLDTNVLLSDPKSMFSFEEHNVIIPLVVLEELDRQKSRQDEVGRNARHVSRILDDLRSNGNSLLNGVVLPNGGKLSIQMLEKEHIEIMPAELESKKVDNLIIVFMMWLQVQHYKELENALLNVDCPVLISQDINVRIKCDSVGVKCEDYRKMRSLVTSDEEFYSGVDVIEVAESLINDLYENKELLTDNLPQDIAIYPNQIFVLKTHPDEYSKKSAITRYDGEYDCLVPIVQSDDVFGLRPRNKEQNFSFDLLMNPKIKLITLVGSAGTGKTILALAAGLEQLTSVGKKSIYDRIIVTRPVQPLGKDIGFLPGTLEEKMDPWLAPIKDNLNFLMGNISNTSKRKPTGKSKFSTEPYLSLLQDRGLIEIEAITFIRGRSIPNSFIVIDEAQNLSMHELKTIITRVGDGSKIILTGDIEQIDNVHVDSRTNGLTYAVEKFKEHDIAAHVTLIKGERSPLATLASKIL